MTLRRFTRELVGVILEVVGGSIVVLIVVGFVFAWLWMVSP